MLVNTVLVDRLRLNTRIAVLPFTIPIRLDIDTFGGTNTTRWT